MIKVTCKFGGLKSTLLGGESLVVYVLGPGGYLCKPRTLASSTSGFDLFLNQALDSIEGRYITEQR